MSDYEESPRRYIDRTDQHFDINSHISHPDYQVPFDNQDSSYNQDIPSKSQPHYSPHRNNKDSQSNDDRSNDVQDNLDYQSDKLYSYEDYMRYNNDDDSTRSSERSHGSSSTDSGRDSGHRRRRSSSRVYRERAVSDSIRKGTDDDDVDSIVVYLLTDRAQDCDSCNTTSQVDALIKFFKSSSFYILHVINIAPPSSVNRTETMTEDQAIEIYRYNHVLTDASNKYPNKYVMVIKDKTVTVTSPDILESVVRTATQLAGWQLCYLNRWLDACEQYTNRVDVEGDSMIALVKTISPNSTQSILFSPEGRDIVIGRARMNNGKYFTPIAIPLGEKLNREIVDSNMTAMCTVPNVFSYNLFDTESISDLAKLSSCRRPVQTAEDPDKPGTIPFLLFVLLVIIVFLALWALYVLGPSNRKELGKSLEVQVTPEN